MVLEVIRFIKFIQNVTGIFYTVCPSEVLCQRCSYCKMHMSFLVSVISVYTHCSTHFKLYREREVLSEGPEGGVVVKDGGKKTGG